MALWLYPEFRLETLEYDGAVRADAGSLICNGGAAHIAAKYHLQDSVNVTMDYRISEDGSLYVKGHLSAPASAPELFRIGLEFAMNGSFDNLDYYGLGPFENYCDLKAAARLGHYHSKVGEQYNWSYIRPQESGNHEDLRFIRLTDGNGAGLFALSDTLFSGSALPLSREELDLSIHQAGDIHTPAPLTWAKNYHSYELLPLACLDDRSRGNTWVHLDTRQMGVGGINTWGALPLEKYRIPAGDYDFAFRLIPLAGQTDR